jgi:hypothetical protein
MCGSGVSIDRVSVAVNTLDNLTTVFHVVTISNMKAELLLQERLSQGENGFAELVLWRLPVPAPGSVHAFKYRLALVVDGACVLRYDNEAGKGDHKHVGSVETAYAFESPRRLLADFWRDVELWRVHHE